MEEVKAAKEKEESQMSGITKLEMAWKSRETSISGRRDMLMMNDASERCGKQTEKRCRSELLGSHRFSLKSRVLVETRMQGCVGQQEVDVERGNVDNSLEKRETGQRCVCFFFQMGETRIICHLREDTRAGEY